MKQWIFLCLPLFTSSSLFGIITFERWYPSTGRPYSVIQASDCGYVVTGGWDNTLFLMKTDSLGNILWYKQFCFTNNDVGLCLQETPDQGFIITGLTFPPGTSRDVLLLKTNVDGDSLWAKTYGGAYDDAGMCVIQPSEGGFAITGNYGFSSQFDVYLIRADSIGDTSWTRIKGGGGHDFGLALLETNDNGYIIAGNTYSYGPSNSNVYLLKTDSIGSTQWQRAYGGNSEDEGMSIAHFLDGGFAIAGWTLSYGSGASDIYLIRTDSAGDTLWTRAFGGIDYDYGYAVVTTPNKYSIVAGHTQSYGIGGIDFYLIKVDSLGNLVWQRTFGGNDDELGRAMQKTLDGGYIIAGWKEFGVYLVKTDSLGYVAVADGDDNSREIQHSLFQVYPNPFTNRLIFQGLSKVQIFDCSGRFVKEAKGQWDGTNSKGLNSPPGIYFLKADGKCVGKVVKVN